MGRPRMKRQLLGLADRNQQHQQMRDKIKKQRAMLQGMVQPSHRHPSNATTKMQRNDLAGNKNGNHSSAELSSLLLAKWLYKSNHNLLSSQTTKKWKYTSTSQARRSLTYMDVVHCQPQYAFLMDDHGCPVFDFVGHLESFASDLWAVLQVIQSPELLHYYPQVYGNATSNNNNTTTTTTIGKKKETSTSFGSQRKASQLGGNLQRAYDYHYDDNHTHNKETPIMSRLQKAVAEEYAHDFALFGYDPKVVPE